MSFARRSIHWTGDHGTMHARDDPRAHAPMTASDPRRTADAVDAAIARLTTSIAHVDDLSAPSRAVGVSRRDVAVGIAGHLDRATAVLHPHRTLDGRAPADPADDADLAKGDGVALAAAIDARRIRLAAVLDDALVDERPELADELEALLARVELAHVGLDADYDLHDLPPVSLAACARVSEAAARMQPPAPATPRSRPTARRRRGIPWPRGRRSS